MYRFFSCVTPDRSKSVTGLGLTLATLAIFSLASQSPAQTTMEELRAHPEYTGSGYLVYPEPDQDVKYTEAPAGYKPIYISHYGRHGSRYHHSADEYRYLSETLAKADSAGKLTARGKGVLAVAQILAQKAAPRTGDLTQVGAKQHEGIARRMAKNFPELFQARDIIVPKSPSGKLTLKSAKVTPHVDAYASTSGRCIVSMSAFAAGLRSVAPEVDISFESGKDLMKFICTYDWNNMDYTRASAYTAESDKLWAAVNPQPLMKKLFSDSAYVAANIDAGSFYNKLFEIASSLQGMDRNLLDEIRDATTGDAFSGGNRRDVSKGGKPGETSGGKPAGTDFLEGLFTVEESITRWQAQNAWWYSLLGTSPLQQTTQGTDYAKGTLRHILDEADRAIASTYCPDENRTVTNNPATTKSPETAGRKTACDAPTTATLRFGHDAGLLPLAGLMQLSVSNAKVTDLGKLYEQWTDFRIIPMAANLQIIFYKNGDDFKSTAGVKKPKKKAKLVLPAEKPETRPESEILVKFLYNEREVTVPIPCGENCPAAPYYRWEDVKKFYEPLLK